MGQTLQFHKFWRSTANSSINISLSFFPYNWKNSSQVQISFYQSVGLGGGVRFAVDSESLKQDPRQLVEAHLFSSGIIQTGILIDFVTIRLPTPIIAQYLVMPISETESVHGRWRLKKSISKELPSYLSFLNWGRCTDRISLQ
jgi:hypothetical protein